MQVKEGVPRASKPVCVWGVAVAPKGAWCTASGAQELVVGEARVGAILHGNRLVDRVHTHHGRALEHTNVRGLEPLWGAQEHAVGLDAHVLAQLGAVVGQVVLLRDQRNVASEAVCVCTWLVGGLAVR